MEPPLAPYPVSLSNVSTIASGEAAPPPETQVRTPAKANSLTVRGVRQRMKLLTLHDQPLINAYFTKYQPSVCELTFANLLNWNSTYPHYLGKASPHCFCEVDGHLLIGFYDKLDRLKLYQPVGPEPEKLIVELNRESAALKWTCVEESIAKKVGPESEVTSDRDNDDYIYDLREIRALSGEKFHRKRTYIKHCQECHPAVVPLTGAMTESCLEVNRKWLMDKEHPHDTDATALEIALTHFDELRLAGIGVLINGALESFAIGEPLNGTTYVSHFLKANYDFPGLFQYTAYAFAQFIPPSFTHLNKEQDLGLEGLRIAKEGWCPCSMVRKFTIRNANWVTTAPHNTAKQGPTGE
ncbi:MAG: phosphatidylglycerol lysyltransferase domain-containing protein [Candidatus Peribacteraceae bacterium]|nr:phosphatidylglycerol lysyltransferase domain-containing protein [Candidatus Peribacteraceae bacterium]